MRTHTCGEARDNHIGQTVALCGWVHARRSHGQGLLFLDLRDRFGITQIVLDQEDSPADVVERGEKLRLEDCVRVSGEIRARASVNPHLDTGRVEVVVKELALLSRSDPPPVIPGDEKGGLSAESVRMKHRYLDLRRPAMQKIVRTRHDVSRIARGYFHRNGFLEVETPILYKSTPEGAREFIVPSRNSPGTWYALPQSPQLFKQLLMVAGCDRYLQICRCFRDEDPRQDRQVEFSQIDLEMSFIEREDVIQTMEGFARELWGEVLGVETRPFPRLTYREAMDRYGIDRPDTRYGLELIDVSDLAARTEFRVFSEALAKETGAVKAIRVPGGADRLTRKITDGYSEFVKTFGAGGVPVTKVVSRDGGAALEGGIAKFVESIAAELITRVDAAPGDTILFGADTYAVCTKALGELRQRIARDLDMIPDGAWNFLWVVDFPMFMHDAEMGRFFAMHHPFTAPRRDQLDKFLSADAADIGAIESIVSDGYDLVVNGSEIGGGSIRIHQREVQAKVFSILGMTEAQAKEKFSFLLEALRYGPPPHGGIAFGLDRLIMHLCGTENIREVIAFPKTHTGQDLLTEAPSPVEKSQLDELYVASTWRG
ncbi:MAG: aspartate--tRNA ligase [Phycisphaeraceae bacterium]|nr:aspartate--tRNA ligase [Phycisphaeraceae bacterium]